MTDLPVRRLRKRLLDWYDAHRRDLPWRAGPGESADPYQVWLSEIMLQQTRVDTVRPYFQAWLERFPTLEALAEADLDDVLKSWEGLGYYSRARNFHRAVREVVADYGGTVPDDATTFRSLPGVGRYTAGAVMSIAFGLREAVVDGNVRRVFARLLDDPAPADGLLWEIAGAFADSDRPGDVNQALMELGAMVCTPRGPECRLCPLHRECAAFAAGTQNERPAPRRKATVAKEEHGVAIVQRAGAFLVTQRPESGRLGGMWEFPGVARRDDESAEEAAVRALGEKAGLSGVVRHEYEVVRHVFSHVVVRYLPFRVDAEPNHAAADLPERARWATRREIGDLALPAAQHRILAQLES